MPPKKRETNMQAAGVALEQRSTTPFAMADFRLPASMGSGVDSEIPKEWKERASRAWELYVEEPIVQNCINSWRAFSLGDEIKPTSDDQDAQDVVAEKATALELTEWVKDMILQLLTKGDAIGFRMVKGNDITELVCVNPSSCDVTYKNGALVEVKQFEEKNGVRGEGKTLDLDNTIHIRWNAPKFSARGNSMIVPVFEPVALLREYRKAEKAIAKRWSTPFRQIKVGGQFGQKVIIPTQRDLEAYRDLINKMDLRSGLVTPFFVEVKTHGTDGQVLEVEKKTSDIKEDIMVGLGLSRALVTGDGPNFSTAEISLKKMCVMIREIKQIALKLCMWSLGYWSERNGVTAKVQYEINDLDPTDELGFKKMLADLYDKRLISRKTLQSKLGLNPEIERKNQEGDKADVFSASMMKPIAELVIAGVLSVPEARKLLGMETAQTDTVPAAPEQVSAALAAMGMQVNAGRICDECRSHTTASNRCEVLGCDRSFADPACRFFGERTRPGQT